MEDDADVCGHETADGTPCQNPATDDGSCWLDAHGGSGNKSGRPTKLSHAKQEAIAADIEQGRSMRSAARKQDLSPQTVFNWMQRGEADLEEGKENEYTQFFERITRAKGYGEEWYMKTIIELAEENEDHRFLMSLMKQRYPGSWGETETGVEADTVKLEVSSDVKRTWPE